MATARVFKSGNSQAVRLPKEFRLKGPEVEISRRGDEIILREKKPKSKGMEKVVEILQSASFDFLDEPIDDPPPQRRKSLDEL